MVKTAHIGTSPIFIAPQSGGALAVAVMLMHVMGMHIVHALRRYLTLLPKRLCPQGGHI